jgi:tyrosyl-tRNA synthetase
MEYMLSTADNNVERLLKLFTFLPLSEISSLMAEQSKDPSRRIAQHRLAFEFLSLAHGEVVAEETADLHRSRAGQRKSISLSQLLPSSEGHDMKPEDTFTATLAELESWRLPDVLIKVGIAETKSEGQRLVSSKGLYVIKESSDKAGTLDWVQLSAENKNESAVKFVIWTEEQGILLLRAGKWKVKKLVLQK